MLEYDEIQNELSQINFELDFLKRSPESVLTTWGDTTILSTIKIESISNSKRPGQLSVDYHVSKTAVRNGSDANSDSEAISALLTKVLNQTLDLEKIKNLSIVISCDVLKKAGGTFNASIASCSLLLTTAMNRLVHQNMIESNPVQNHIASITIGKLQSETYAIDLTMEEELTLESQGLIVMDELGGLVYSQFDSKKGLFSALEMSKIYLKAQDAIDYIIQKQKDALENISLNTQTEGIVMDKSILIATKNKGKAQEFCELFEGRGIKVQTLLDYPEIESVAETGTTFEANARLKAETIAKKLNCLVLADDSGLKVDALSGQPGVYSARFAGKDATDAANNAKLLHELTEVPDDKRTAQFHCTLVLAQPGKESLVVSGEVKGLISRIPRGENGFGYDPLFMIPELNQTMAELSSEEKNKRSHRFEALKQLDSKLDQWL